MGRAMNALFDKLRQEIIETGPLTVEQFLTSALSDPDHGYYITRDPFGARGDFTTAPEISQIFGELIGLWSAALWQSMGEPHLFNWVELGPGRGTLMADAVRATRKIIGFHEACHIHMIETSPVLRASQQKSLTGAGVEAPHWHTQLSQVPAGPMICIANEFFDALPVRHFKRNITGWVERMVGLNTARDGLAFLWSAQIVKQNLIPEVFSQADDGTLIETSPAGLQIMSDLAARIATYGGAGLVLDYGHTRSAHGETLQALRDHQYTNVLDAPGEQDLTAHVDFAALGRVAQTAGLRVHGPCTQGAFLNGLGLGLRTRALQDNAGSPQQARAVFDGANRLVDPAQMGDLFKVLAIAHETLEALPALPLK